MIYEQPKNVLGYTKSLNEYSKYVKYYSKMCYVQPKNVLGYTKSFNEYSKYVKYYSKMFYEQSKNVLGCNKRIICASGIVLNYLIDVVYPKYVLMMIFFCVIIMSYAFGLAINSFKFFGIICHLTPYLSMHQPH